MKDKKITIPAGLKPQIPQILDQLHSNHIGMEKTRLLGIESIHWINMNVDIEYTINICSTYLWFQQTHPKEKIISHEIQGKPWKATGTDLFTINNSNFLCIIDYHSKFAIVEKKGKLSVDSLST